MSLHGDPRSGEVDVMLSPFPGEPLTLQIIKNDYYLQGIGQACRPKIEVAHLQSTNRGIRSKASSESYDYPRSSLGSHTKPYTTRRSYHMDRKYPFDGSWQGNLFRPLH